MARQKILCIKLRALGDTVIWSAALAGLKKQWPQAEITVLTFHSNFPILKNHPAVDHFIGLKTNSRWELIRMFWKLRATEFHTILGFHVTARIWKWSWLLRSKNKALHHHSYFEQQNGNLVIPNAGHLESALHRDFRVLEALSPHQILLAPQIYLTDEEKKTGKAKLDQILKSLSLRWDRPLFVFLPGAAHHLRRYPQDLYFQLLKDFKATQPDWIPLVLVDNKLAEDWKLDEFCFQNKIPILSQLPLREMLSVLSHGSRALVHDSGPGHMARALGLKTFFIFGPGCVGDWHPYEKKDSMVFRIDVSCRDRGPKELDVFRFCTVNSCEHHSCMRNLKIQSNFLTQYQFEGAT